MTTFAFPAPFGLEPFFEPFLQAAAMHVPHQQQYVHHKHQQQQRRDQNNQQPQRKQAAAAAATEPAGAAAKAKAAPKAALLPAPVVPPCNIFETDAAYWIQVEVPGATSEPEVVAHENKLVVKGAIGASALPEGARPLRRERARAARYERTFSLPENGVDAEGIEATLEAGVLTIVVPKVQPQAPAPKRIKVKVGGAAGAAAAAEAAAPAAPPTAAKKSVRLAVAEDDDDEGSVEDASDDHDDDERMQA